MRGMATFALILALLVALVPPAGQATPIAGPARLVKDINTNTLSSTPSVLTVAGNILYFVANDNNTITSALWRSDGTAAGTTLITRRIDSTSALIYYNGAVIYSYQGDLWKADGTSGGTAPVKDIYRGTAPSPNGISNLRVLNGNLFFLGRTDDTLASELWRSDGTSAGTLPVAGVPLNLLSGVVVRGAIYFLARFGAQEYTLWKSDGTPAGTAPVKTIPALSAGNINSANTIGPALGDADPPPAIELVEVNGALFFSIRDLELRPPYVSGLWKSDGTADGTILLLGANLHHLHSMDGLLLFIGADSAHGFELWKSDGTSAGTTIVKDIHPGPASTFGLAALTPPFADSNGILFFSADGGLRGTELWRTDGTAAGTLRVADINPGAAGSYPTELTIVNGMLFFVAYNASGSNVWKSDGTASGTALVKDIAPGALDTIAPISNLTDVHGTLFFIADDIAHGVELWKSDGTPLGTVLIKDINTAGASSQLYTLQAIDHTLFFVAEDSTRTLKLLKSDGTALGTVQVVPSQPFVSPFDLTPIDNTLFFTASDSSHGDELWRSDGTAAGTFMVKDINSGPSSSYPFGLHNHGGTLFFFANDGVHDQELWKSDGTPAGTLMVKDISPSYASNPGVVGDLNGTLYFTIDDGIHGYELWKSDGTSAGTQMVKDLTPGSGSTFFGAFTSMGGSLFFNVDGFGLWKSDGTAAGTIQISPVGIVSGLVNANGTLFFFAGDSAHGFELWKSDGTAAGTALVKDIWPGRRNDTYTGMDEHLASLNGLIYVVINDGVHGFELWRSDGTAAGTFLLKDIFPGLQSSSIFNLTNVKGTLLFTAEDGSGYSGLWSSDGTPQGTTKIQDIGPVGPVFYNVGVAYITLVGSSVYFTADDGVIGKELWHIPLGAGTQLGLRAPALVGAAPSGLVGIPLSYLNTGAAQATALTLVATLDPRMTYAGDNTGIQPTVQSNIVTWSLPNLGVLGGRELRLLVRLPDAPLGTRFPVELRLTAAGSTTTMRTEVMAADMRYLPVVSR